MPAGFVQAVQGSNVSSAGTVSFPGVITHGNTVVVWCPWSYNGCPPSLTDSLGNTYTAVQTGALKPTGGQAFWLFTAPVSTGGACTITLHAACGVSAQLVAVEVAGLVAVSPFDSANVGVSTGNPNLAGSVTPSQDGEYVAALFYDTASFGTPTANSGFTLELTDNDFCAYIDILQGTAAAINPSINSGASVSFPAFGYAACFKAVVSASSAPRLALMGVGQ